MATPKGVGNGNGLTCWLCGDSNHFIHKCPFSTTCRWCNRKGHTTSQCYFKHGKKKLVGFGDDYTGTQEINGLISAHLMYSVKEMHLKLKGLLELMDKKEEKDITEFDDASQKKLRTILKHEGKKLGTFKANQRRIEFEKEKKSLKNAWCFEKELVKKKCKDSLSKGIDILKSMYICVMSLWFIYILVHIIYTDFNTSEMVFKQQPTGYDHLWSQVINTGLPYSRIAAIEMALQVRSIGNGDVFEIIQNVKRFVSQWSHSRWCGFTQIKNYTKRYEKQGLNYKKIPYSRIDKVVERIEKGIEKQEQFVFQNQERKISLLVTKISTNPLVFFQQWLFEIEIAYLGNWLSSLFVGKDCNNKHHLYCFSK